MNDSPPDPDQQLARTLAPDPAEGLEAAAGRSPWKPLISWGIKFGILAAVVWGARRTLLSGIEQLRSGQIDVELHFGWLALAGVLYLLGLLPCGLFWHRLLLRFGQRAYVYETLRAYYIGHLGKYVPGKALVVILRAGLIRSSRVSPRVAAVTVFYETLTFMAVGSSLATLVLAILFGNQTWLVGLGIVLAIVAGVPTLPPVFLYLARRAGIGRNATAEAEPQAVNIPASMLLWAWISIAAGWVAIGGSLALTLVGMGVEEVSLAELPLYTAATALALVAGFLSLLPGGVGVRELVLMELLAPLWADESSRAAWAVTAALVLRLVWLVSEAAVSAILYVFPRGAGGEAAPPARPIPPA